MTRRRVLRSALLLALALAGAPLAQAQGAPQAASDPRARLEATALRYQAKGWPVSGPRLAGVELGQVAKRLPGWTAETTVDPVRGEARLRLAPEGGPVQVLATIRLFADGAAARDALLGALGSLQRQIDRAEVGEVGYAGRVGDVPALAYAVRGNVFLSVRALDLERPVDVTPAARALDALVGGGQTLAPGQPLPAPAAVDLRVLGAGGLGAGVVRAGHSARVEVVCDPRGPAAAHLRFECEGDVSVVALPDGGLELLAPTAGSYTVRVWACSATLVAAPAVELKVAIDP